LESVQLRAGGSNVAETFAGRVALVTGGSTGIGRATAFVFARERARVVVADINVEDGEKTVARIKREGGEGLFIRTDVSVAAEVQSMVERIIETYGRLDCAFNNAGVMGSITTPTHEYPDQTWDEVIAVNLKGVWLCMKSEIPQMLTQGGGTIVNTCSIYGVVGGEAFAAYVASKHGIAGLTKTAALEYIKSGIRINAVTPGPIDTAMTRRFYEELAGREEWAKSEVPMGRIGQPEEVAEAVVWLCSPAASYVVGHIMMVDGGWVAK
jgi:NAD(P)-dependent dehydrogenase (short-subunit alcohol dehydrogenase family)